MARTAAEFRGKIDAVILTIRQDEDDAVKTRLGKLEQVVGDATYQMGRIQGRKRDWTIAVHRMSEQANSAAQQSATTAILDLDPRLLVLVGIAGGVPSEDFSLGDVMVATSIADLRVRALNPDQGEEYDTRTSPMSRALVGRLSNLSPLLGWSNAASIGMAQPAVQLTLDKCKGDKKWKEKVLKSLTKNFGNGPREPIWVTGQIASQDAVLKDPEVLKRWRQSARKVEAVEMEAAGVCYAAARNDAQYPALVIRGLSDVVGYARDELWTKYACNTAAAFTIALLKSGQLDDIQPLRKRPDETANPVLLENGDASLIHVHKEPVRRGKKVAPAATSGDALALERLAALQHPVFTRRFVVPLLRALDPKARIDEAYSQDGSGTDLVFITKHGHLSRQHIILLLVRSHQIATKAMGTRFVASIANEIQIMKTAGVCVRKDHAIKPHEIWILNYHIYSESQRRISSELPEKFSALDATYIDGIEFLNLLRRNCPELISDLVHLAAPELVKTIATLSAHQESRAFGLRIDRSLSDFHVAARACPSTARTARLMQGALEFERHEVQLTWVTTGSDYDRLVLRGKGIDPEDVKRLKRLADLSPIVTEFAVPSGWVTSVTRTAMAEFTRLYQVDAKKISVKWRAPLSSRDYVGTKGQGIRSEDQERSKRIDELAQLPAKTIDAITWQAKARPLKRSQDQCRVQRTYIFDLGGIANKVQKELRAMFKMLPASLTDDPNRVAEVVHQIAKTERLIAACEALGALRYVEGTKAFKAPDVAVPDELQLLKIGSRLLVEGPPGSGKTTLLRRLAIALLDSGRQVIFLACSNLRREHSSDSLDEIARKLSPEGTPTEWRLADSILLVDGMDEAPFDLSKKILDLPDSVPHIVATTRVAHETSLRDRFLRLEVAPFSADDRDEFFRRWFRHDAARLESVLALTRRHHDMGLHLV